MHFGHVSDWTDWLALTGFVELSYSPGRIFDDPPELDLAPVSAVSSAKAPSARLVEQAFTGIAPGTLFKSVLWSEPPMRDFHPLGLLRPSPV